MRGIEYLYKSSMEIGKVGSHGERIQIFAQIAVSPKEVVTRLCKNPKWKLISADCVVSKNSYSKRVILRDIDLVAFRLPVNTNRISLKFATRVSESRERFIIAINLTRLVNNEIEVLGERNAVIDLCSWLKVRLPEFS